MGARIHAVGVSNRLIRNGAHARIRTGDLFLTKWSWIPGEFELILPRAAFSGPDHLTRLRHLALFASPLSSNSHPARRLLFAQPAAMDQPHGDDARHCEHGESRHASNEQRLA